MAQELDFCNSSTKLASMKINYTAGLHKVREAYFKWRDAHPYIKASVMSFTAGYNAALAEIKANASKLTEPKPDHEA
jgi:hypothetical protein